MNKKTKLITIITPSLNSEKYIRECVESVHNQIDDRIEHIVIDGGSADRTLTILEEFKYIKIIKQKTNIYQAYNLGIKNAEGKFIFLLNSDDKINSDTFINFYDIYKKYPDNDLYCSNGLEYNYNFKNIIRSRPFTPYFFFNRGIIDLKSQSILGCYIKKDIFARFNYFDEKLTISSDKDFLIKLAINRITAININHYSYLIRSHDDSLTFGKNKKKNILKTVIKENLNIISSSLKKRRTSIGVKFFLYFFKNYRHIQQMKLEKKSLIAISYNLIFNFNFYKLINYFLLVSVYKVYIQVFYKR